ncbi:UNVERIFIED_CONTAM: hypothetical protein FKN15_026524 [Acipenser sinensis]
MVWPEAWRYCRDHYTDLVNLTSLAAQNRVSELVRNSTASRFWIGLHRTVVYDNWYWVAETSNITERYTLIEEMKNWTEAQQYCREHHTDLISIKNASENEDLVKKAQGKTFWIGLFNEPWKWSHQGDNYTFHNWFNGEPDNWGGNENCVRMLKSGTWRECGCNSQYPFFCYDGTPVPEDLHLISDSMVWPEAWQYCKNHYTDLVNLTSLAAQNRVSELVRNSTASRFWIGLHRTVVYVNWYWVAGFCVPTSNQIIKHVFVNTLKSWSEAQSYCIENHIDLATVHSQEEAQQLLNIAGASLSDSAWIGLYRDGTQNWQWSNSDDVIYSNWRADLFCASVNSVGQWEDRVCSEMKASMCYQGFCVPTSNQIIKHVFVKTLKSWSTAQTYCRENHIDLATVHSQEEGLQQHETSNITERYTLIEELKTWTEAQQYCREHHTDLVSIKNASENEDLVKKAQGKTFWIGLFNEPWKWSHQGDNYTFHYWNTGQPDNGGGNEKCVRMFKSGTWGDKDCNILYPFFCYDDPTPSDPLSTLLSEDGGEQSQQPSTMGSTSPRASSPSHSSSWLPGTSPARKGTPVPEDLHLISDSMVWLEAWQYCRDHYTDLVSLTSLAAQNRVSELVRNSTASRFWIGLHRTVVYDNWYWVEDQHGGEAQRALSDSHTCRPAWGRGTESTV